MGSTYRFGKMNGSESSEPDPDPYQSQQTFKEYDLKIARKNYENYEQQLTKKLTKKVTKQITK